MAGSITTLPADCITVTGTLADALPERAVTVALPLPTAVTRPWPLTEATCGSLLDQTTSAPDTSSPFPSTTEAVSCTVSPRDISAAVDGSITTLPADCVTVTGMLADTLPERAVTVALPLPTAVTRPCPLTVATDASLIDQTTATPLMTAFF